MNNTEEGGREWCVCVSACIWRLLKNTSELTKTDSEKIRAYEIFEKKNVKKRSHKELLQILLYALVLSSILYPHTHTHTRASAQTHT